MTTTTFQRQLTLTTDPTLAAVSIPEPELSGAQWVSRFPGSASTADLDADFGKGVDAFVAAIKAAGGSVAIAATYRPPERAYLMRASWEVGKEKLAPSKVAPMAGVNINWDHGDDAKSIAAAQAMMDGYGIAELGTRPALHSRHTERKAIDMTIGWKGDLTIKDASGTDVVNKTEPCTGMNLDLQEIGRSYGVIKFWKGATDKPHWSTDGK